MNWSIEYNTVQTNPGNSINSSSPVGIGYLATFDKYLIVNNIDRNSEISEFAQPTLEPIAVYDQTIYPNDAENSGFDLDIHAVLYDSLRKSLLMLNHFGRLRFFDTDSLIVANKPIQMTATGEAMWIGDVEQTLLAGDCLISSSPGDYHVPGSARPGLYVSSPLSLINHKINLVEGPQKLNHAVHFAEMGYVSAIAVNHFNDLLAVGFGQNVIILSVAKQKNGTLLLNNIVAQFQMNFYCRFLSFWKEKYLIGAGHDVEFKDNVHDPSNLKGGGFMVASLPDNEILSFIPFNRDLAWGNGGQCLTFLNAHNSLDDMFILGVDRQANLWSWHWQNDNCRKLVSNEVGGNGPGYGIGHVAWQQEKLFCGYNRDGSRLHIYNFARI